MTFERTSEEVEAEIAEWQHVPTRDDVEHLLHTYFTPLADAATIDRLDSELRDLLADRARRSSMAASFAGNGRRYFGQAWKELRSRHKNPATPTELIIWIAITSRGYPRPRPYCPAELVGTWRQIKPAAATWTLTAEGGMETTDEWWCTRDQWCVHRVTEGNKKTTVYGEFFGDIPPSARAHYSILFTSKRLVNAVSMSIDTLTRTMFHATRHGLDGPIEYILERV